MGHRSRIGWRYHHEDSGKRDIKFTLSSARRARGRARPAAEGRSITVDLGGVGGPSAGPCSLGIVDVLTPGDLTGGRFVAGTGAITADGEVQNIGGIQFKMAAARAAGATVFLLPVGVRNGAARRAAGPATGEGGHAARRRHRPERPQRGPHARRLLNTVISGIRGPNGEPHTLRTVGTAGAPSGRRFTMRPGRRFVARRPQRRTLGACPVAMRPPVEPRRCPAVPGYC